jgi:hypothetical protein
MGEDDEFLKRKGVDVFLAAHKVRTSLSTRSSLALSWKSTKTLVV